MWLSDRRKFLLLGLAMLSGCGYRPVYGPGGVGNMLRGQVLARAPADDREFVLVHQLEQRFGRTRNARYGLDYRLELREAGLAITPAQETTRFHVLGKAGFVLHDRTTGSRLASGTVDSFTSYSATGTTVNTQAARDDAYRRLMVILADKIVSHLFALSPEVLK